MRIFYVFILVMVFATSSAFTLKDTLYDRVGQQYGIHPALLYALTLAESATGTGDRISIQPWPYTIRTTKGPELFTTQEAAIARLGELLDVEKHPNIDIGLAQINYYWHHQKISNIAELMDPEKNLIIAAEILNEGCKSANSLKQCIARYNSWRATDASRAYAERVLAYYQSILTLIQETDE